MANIDERIVKLSMDDTSLQQGVLRVTKALEQLKKAFEFNDTKSFDNLDKAAKNVKFDNVSKSASEMQKDVSKATSKVTEDFAQMGSDAQKSVQQIETASSNVDLAGVSSAANKMSNQVQQSAAEANAAIGKIGTNTAGIQQTVDAIDGVNDAANRVDLSPIQKGVETVKMGISSMRDSLMHGVNAFKATPIGEQLDAIQPHFKALEAVGIVALGNLAAKAVTTGAQMADRLTKGIRQGFEEYELQLNSVQTILANTQKQGTNLTQVNTALNQLNTYADQTIYNFSEMTKNIGTFTAAGVDLQTSVNSIKGIANLAAISGSSSQQASTAMYQLSQALAAGKVSLMDWNSVVNAGMGGQVFQDLLVQTSEKLGTGAKQYIAAEGSFRESLTKGQWLTTDVLTQSLNILAMDVSDYEKAVASLVSKGYTEQEAKDLVKLAQTANDAATKVKTFSQLMDTTAEAVGSGWTQTWQILVGDFEESKDLWTGISNEIGNIVNANAAARNALLTDGFASGYKQLISKGIVDTQSFQDILVQTGDKAGEGASQAVQEYGSFEKSLQKGWLSANTLKSGVQQLTDKVNGYDDATKQSLGITNAQINQLNELNQGLQNGSISAEEFAKKMSRMSGRQNVIQGLANIWNSLKTIIQTVGKAWDEVMPKMNGETIYAATEAFRKFTEGLKPSPQLLNVISVATKVVAMAFKLLLGVVTLVFKGFGALLSFGGKIAGVFINIASAVINGVRAFAQYVKQSQIVVNIVKLWQAALSSLGTIVETIGNAIGGVFDGLFDGINKGASGFPDILGIISKSLAGCVDEVNNYGTEFKTAFRDKFGAVPEIAAKVSDKVSAAVQSLKPVFDWIADRVKEIGAALQRFFGNLNGEVTLDQILSLINGGLLTGVLMGLRKFIKGLNEVGEELEDSTFKGALKKTLKDIGDSFKDFAKSFKIVSIVAIAASIKLLADALTQLSTIDTDKVMPAIGSLTTIIAVMTGMMVGLSKLAALTNKYGDLQFNFDSLNKVALAMVALGLSMKLMAEAAFMLKDMNLAQIAVIFGAMSAAILSIGGSIALMGLAKPKALNAIGTNMMKVGAGFVLIASSLVVLATAVLMLASLKPEALSRSMNAVAMGIILLTTAMAGLGAGAKFGADYSGIGKNILLIAMALIPLAIAVKMLGRMDFDGLTQGLGAVTIGLIAISGAMAGLGYIQGIGGSYEKSAAAIMAFAAAMLLLSIPIKKLGSMDLTSLAKGVGALVITLGAFAGAMALFSKFNGTYAGMLMASGAILAFAAAATALIIPIKVLGAMDFDTLLQGLFGLAMALAGMVTAMNYMPENMAGQAAGMVALAGGITALAVAIRIMGSMKIEQLVTGLIGFYGALVGLGFAGQVLGPMAVELMAVAKAMAMFGVACLAIGAGMALAGAGLMALSATGSAAGGIIVAALDALIMFIPALAKSLFAAIVGVLQVIVAALPQILEALASILGQVSLWLVQQVPMLAEATVTMIDKTLKIVAKHADSITNSLVTILVAALNAVAGHAPEITAAIGKVLTAIFNAIADSIHNLDPRTLTSLLLSVGTMALLFKALAKMKKDVIGALMVGGVMIGLMTALTGVFALMNLLNPVTTLASAVSLSTALIAMTGALKIMQTAKKDVIGALAVGSAMVAILGELTLVFGLMSVMNIDNMAVIAASLSTTILAISGAAAIMGMVNVGSAMSGIASLATFIAGLTGIIVAAGAIKQIPGADWLISEGAAFMAKIGAALGGFVGSILGAITGSMMESIGNNLPKLATGLSNFMTSLKPFIDGAKQIDGSVVTAVGALASVILKLTAADFLNAITKFISGSDGVENFGAKLVPLGQGLKQFSLAVAGMDTKSISASAQAAKSLTDVLNALPASDGLWQKIAGKKDWGTLSNGLVRMGTTLKSYGATVTDLQSKPIRSSITALTALNDLLNNVPSDDGWWQKVVGRKNWGTLSKGLEGMGKALAGYGKAVSADGVDIGVIKKSVPAVRTLNDVLNNVPPDDGWWQKLTGSKNWSTLTDGLKGLGKALAGYGKAVSADGVDVGVIKKSVPAVKSLTEILKSDFSKMGNFTPVHIAAVQLGTALHDYYVQVSGVDIDKVKDSFKPLRSLVNTIKDLGEQKIEGASTGFITAATHFGVGLWNYYSEVSGVDVDKVGPTFKPLRSLVNTIKDIAKKKIEGKSNGFITAATQLGKGLNDYYVQVSGVGIDKVEPTFKPLRALVKVIKDLGSQEIEGVSTGFITAATQLGKGLNDYYVQVSGVGIDKINPTFKPLGSLVKVIKDINGQKVEGVSTGFITAATQLGIGLYRYYAHIDGLDVDEVKKSFDPLGSLVKVVKGFVDQKIEGVSTGFITAATQLGKGLSNYYDKVRGITPDIIEPTLKPLGSLVKVIKDLDGKKIEGVSNGFDKAATQLGVGLWDYYSEVSGVGIDKVEPTLKPLGSLVKVIKDLDGKKIEGVSNGFDAAATQLGRGLSDYYVQISGVGVDKVKDSFDPLKSLLNIVKDLDGKKIEGVSNGFITAATHLGVGMWNYYSEISGVAIDKFKSSFEPLKSLVEVVKGFVDQKIEGVSNGFDAAATQLGRGLSDYYVQISGVGVDKVKPTLELLNSLVEVTKNLVDQKIEGVSNGFDKAATKLGIGLWNYYSEVSGVGIDKVTPTLEPLGSLVDVVKGFVDKRIEGASTGFITAATQLGVGLSTYYNKVSSIKPDTITPTFDALGTLVETAKNLSDQKIEGASTGFITAATQLGIGLWNYYSEVSGVGIDKVTPTFDALNSLVTIVKDFVDKKIEGASTGFITAATQLGVGLSNYANHVSGLDLTNVQASATAIGDISKAIGEMPTEYTGVPAFQKAVSILADTTLSALSTNLQNANAQIPTALSSLSNALSNGSTSMAASVKALNDSLGGVNFGKTITDQMNAAKSAADSGSDKIKSGLDGLASWLSSFASTWQQSFDPMVGATRTGLNLVSQAISSYNDGFYRNGRDLSNNLANGMRAGSSNISGIFIVALSNAVTEANKYRGSFEDTGAYLIKGIAAGISKNSSAVSDAAAKAVKDAVTAAKQVGDINSPSRVMAKVGMWFDKGLENGIADNVGGVVRAAKTMMTSSIDIVDSSLSSIGKIDIPDFDVNPTITPVMDLSVVEGQAAYLNSMLADTIGIGYSSKMIDHITAIPSKRDTNSSAETAEKVPQQVINNYDFTQNNTSPKALSRYDIYKQTRTQFRQFEQMNRNGGR